MSTTPAANQPPAAHQPAHLRVVDTDAEPARRGMALFGQTWTADQLMDTQFPPPRWAVPGLLAEGVSLLAGPPKVGKSWMALGLGLAVAAGGKALDGIPVDPGPVLYLALEDTPLRLQTRMGKLLDHNRAPAALTLATECPPLPQGGDLAIAAWLDRNRDARMVVIDVFAKMRGHSAPGSSAYDADYAAVGRAKRLADHYGVAFVLVHHVRKASSEDFLTEVSGTNGLAGAADATLVLKRARGQADGVLHITGRDVEETEHALAFQPATGAWHLLAGPVEDHALAEARATILRYLRTNPASGPKAIADATGLGIERVKKNCQRMLNDALVCADATGRYRLPGTEAHPDLLGTVPAVPAVPAPGLTSGNTLDFGGHPGDTTVPAVPPTRPYHP